jgi:hypothetical protein
MSEAIIAVAEEDDWEQAPPRDRHERRATVAGAATRAEVKVPFDQLPPTAIIMHKDLPPGAKYSRTHQYRLVKLGLFPQKVRLSPGRTGWRQRDVNEWLATRPTVVPGERTHSDATKQKMKASWDERRRRAAERLLAEAD